MYIPGHLQLLGEALDLLSVADQQYLFNIPHDHFDAVRQSSNTAEAALYDGVIFPDIPCAKRSLTKGLAIQHDKLKSCNHRKLVSVSANKFSERYATHKGALSSYHSMAPLTSVSVQSVRDDTVKLILVLLATSLMDDTTASSSKGERLNIYWLGIALHVLMDSYSPAHTLRNGRQDDVDYAFLKKQMVPLRSQHTVMPNDTKTDEWAIRMQQSAEAVAKDLFRNRSTMKDVTSPDGILDLILENMMKEQDTANVSHQRALLTSREVVDLLQIFMMYAHNARIESLFSIDAIIERSPKTKKKAGHVGIATFFNYNTQSNVFHMKHDLLSYVDKYGYREELLSECARLMSVFIDTARNLEACGSTAEKRKRVKKVVAGYGKHLLEGSFSIMPGFENTHCLLTAELLKISKQRAQKGQSLV